jgi:TRAP transporter TAXI family solute receptor
MGFWLPWILGSFIVLAFSWRFAGPLPPRHVGMATGARKGAYHAYAEAYAKVFAASGVGLEPRETAGSLENYRLLQDPASGIQVAIVQGGTKPPEERGLMAIASVFLEPIWIFVRSETPVTDLKELAGRRISIGVPESGTRAVAAQLLAATGIRAGGNTEFLEMELEESIAALKTGAIDAAFFVSAPNVEYLKELLRAPGVRLMDFRMAESYSRIFTFLRPIRLPRGTLDLEANLPADDINLVAPVASLIAREDLHPAIVLLLLEGAQEVHSGEGLLAAAGTFPSNLFTESPIDPVARDFFRSGPPFSRRYLPFWVAAWINRLKILIIPLIVILFPLFKLAPPLYRWRIRRKVYRWYEDLWVLDRLQSDASQW